MDVSRDMFDGGSIEGDDGTTRGYLVRGFWEVCTKMGLLFWGLRSKMSVLDKPCEGLAVEMRWWSYWL